MKKLTNLFFMSFVAAGLFSCSSNDDPVENENELQDTDKVYMQVKVQLPTANSSRSKTDEEGNSNSNADKDTEPGTDAECKINTFRLALCNDKHEIIAVSQLDKANIIGGKDTYTATFNQEDLEDAAGQSLLPYVIVNEGNTLTNGLKDEPKIKTIEGVYESITDFTAIPKIGSDKLIMTNYDVPTKVELPALKTLKGYNVPEKAYPITKSPIKIERAYARFDYAKQNENNTYTIQTEAKPGEDFTGSLATDMFEIQLTGMIPTNISKDFYYFRRVSDNGLTEGSNFAIGGVETPTNYVVDVWANDKKDWTNGTAQNANLLSTFHVNKNFTKEEPKYISLEKENDDQWESESKLEYSPKFYMTENTMAQGVANPEIPTTIVFKGQIQLTENGKSTYGTRFNESEALFVFRDHLYLDWGHVKTAATATVSTEDSTPLDPELAAAYQYVETNRPQENIISPENKGKFNDLCKKSGFKVFAKNNGDTSVGVWYYYTNKHNDAFGDEGEREKRPMEYAVVRNNVYKLAVTKIMKFGHPKDSTADPDPINPFNENVYISVSLQVLPWTVRENNIIF